MRRRLRGLTCAALLLAGSQAAPADAPRDLIRQGNEHYAAGRYAEALKCYEQAEAAAPQPSAESLHNLAAAHFKLGQLDEARDLWVWAKAAPDAAFEARTRYNLGNCNYADALALAPQNAQQALAQLAEAATQYQTALRLDPTLTDARANLELTQLLKRQIEEQQQNQPQSQPTTSQSQQDQQNQQQQPSTQPSQSQPSEQSQRSEQDQPPTTQPAQPEDQQPPEDEQQKPPESQPSATPETMPAETQPAEPEQTGNEAQEIHLTREQAERLLQMIRDAEKARRERLAEQQTAQQKPVERDW